MSNSEWEFYTDENNTKMARRVCPGKPVGTCPQLPGTILRVFIPAGAVVNLLNLIELSSPGGICLILRLPILGGGIGNTTGLAGILDSVKQAGGRVEVVDQ